jgi:WD40 repeat protein
MMLFIFSRRVLSVICKEAVEIVTAALEPEILSQLQVGIFQGSWEKQSYRQIASELGHEYGYIKDVGAELWQILTRGLGRTVTKLNLQDAVRQYAQHGQGRGQLAPPPIPSRTDWGEAVDVSQFCGRQVPLDTLEHWVNRDRCRLVTIAGMGGIGKTMLVTQLAKRLADQGEFTIVVWRSLRQAPLLVEFLAELILAIGAQISTSRQLDEMLRHSLEYLRQHRCLVVLDNVEAILSDSGELLGTYRSGYENYGWLFQQLGAGLHQSSILLTSREVPAEVTNQVGPDASVRLLRLEPLSIVEGETILAAKGLKFQPGQSPVCELIERYQGNPLALKIVATPIQTLYNSNIADFLAEATHLFKDIRDLLAQQFGRLSLLEWQVMYWLAINREPVSSPQLKADLLPSTTPGSLQDVLVSLDGRSLIEKILPISQSGDVRYTQQPVVMEYVIERFIEQVCQEVKQAEIDCLRSHALLKAQAKDYVREIQVRLVVQPILISLRESQGGNANLVHLLLELLKTQQLQAPLQPGYFSGNVINLLRLLGIDLSRRDFSNLTIWEADLRSANLQGTNFTDADLSRCTFAQSISDVFCVVFSPNGQRIATSHDNGDICLWQVDDGQPIVTFSGMVSWAWSIVFTPDGDSLVISNPDCIVKCLHIPSQTVRREFHGHSAGIWKVAISADGRLLASSGEDPTIRIWDMQTGECLKILEGLDETIAALAFDPVSGNDQPYRLASGGRTVRVWDLESGQILYDFDGHTQGVLAVAFSPDGQTVASSSVDQTIRLWDVPMVPASIPGLERLLGEDNPTATWTLAFSPDGQTLASGGADQTIKLWDVKTQHCDRILIGHTSAVQSIAFSQDGLTLASAALNQSIRLWDIPTGQCTKTWQGYSKVVFSIAFHPNGQILASCHGDKALRLWDVKTGECLNCLRGHTDRISSLAFSPDGKILASGGYDQTIRLWDVQTGKFLQALATQSWVNSVAFSADGQLLASSGVDRIVRLWAIKTGKCIRVIEPSVGWIPAVAFSLSEQHLASASDDGSIKYWDADNAECLLTLKGHSRQSRSIAFDPIEPRLASGSDDYTVKLWNLRTGACLQTLEGHTNTVVSISFHPQGDRLASGSFDHSLKIWDLQQGINISTLEGHTAPIRSVAFHPSEELLASGSEDGTIRFWDGLTGDCRQILTVDRPYESMNISGVTGLTDAQKVTLRTLGAAEY